MSAYVVGIDVSREALDRNPLLDERIVANLQSMTTVHGAYDVVVCWDVLEHLPDPDRAITNICSAVAPNGLLVIGVPHVWSLKALLAKATPLRFHIWVYEHVVGVRQTDSKEQPFQTYLRTALAPEHLQQSVEQHGFETEIAVAYGSDRMEDFFGSRSILWLWKAATRTFKLLSLGRLSDETEVAFVFRRRGAKELTSASMGSHNRLPV